MLVAAVAAFLSLAFAGRASAQTPLQAEVAATVTLPSGGCANGAFACGTANLAGYGPATWTFFPSEVTAVATPCGSSYAATTEFTLASDPSSTLMLDESGSLCGLGPNGAAYRGYFAEPPQAYGHPFAIVGNWTVDPISTGQFSGLTGSGTDLIKVAGAHDAGIYTGTLG